MTTKLSGDIIRFFTKSVPKSTTEPEPEPEKELGAAQDTEPVESYTFTTNGKYIIDVPFNHYPVITACSSGGNSGTGLSGDTNIIMGSPTQYDIPTGGGGGGASLTSEKMTYANNKFKNMTVIINNDYVVISMPNFGKITLNKGDKSPNKGDTGGKGGVGNFTPWNNNTAYNYNTFSISSGTAGQNSQAGGKGGTATLGVVGNYGTGANGSMSGQIINNPYVHIVFKQEQVG